MRSSMSERDITLYVVDVLVAANRIERYVKDFNNSSEFLHSELQWDASLRELQIIGDAVNQLLGSELIDASYRRIVDFRNRIVHGYFGVDEDIVWDVIKKKMPKLIEDLKTVVNEKNMNLRPAIESAIEENKFSEAVQKYLQELL